MNSIITFFNHPFFIVVGGISTVFIIASFFYSLFLVIKGVLPVWYRLGMGLSKKEIVIFAKEDNFRDLKKLLIDSGLFREKNIDIVSSDRNLGVAENKKIYLINWSDWKDEIDKILDLAQDKTALIVYAPPGSIEKDVMERINKKRNAVVTNFRGRLLNDITTSIITISHE